MAAASAPPRSEAEIIGDAMAEYHKKNIYRPRRFDVVTEASNTLKQLLNEENVNKKFTYSLGGGDLHTTTVLDLAILANDVTLITYLFGIGAQLVDKEDKYPLSNLEQLLYKYFVNYTNDPDYSDALINIIAMGLAPLGRREMDTVLTTTIQKAREDYDFELGEFNGDPEDFEGNMPPVNAGAVEKLLSRIRASKAAENARWKDKRHLIAAWNRGPYGGARTRRHRRHTHRRHTHRVKTHRVKTHRVKTHRVKTHRRKY